MDYREYTARTLVDSYQSVAPADKSNCHALRLKIHFSQFMASEYFYSQSIIASTVTYLIYMLKCFQ